MPADDDQAYAVLVPGGAASEGRSETPGGAGAQAAQPQGEELPAQVQELIKKIVQDIIRGGGATGAHSAQREDGGGETRRPDQDPWEEADPWTVGRTRGEAQQDRGSGWRADASWGSGRPGD
eukprot:5187309-Pyramimonas_sp.AAC.1